MILKMLLNFISGKNIVNIMYHKYIQSWYALQSWYAQLNRYFSFCNKAQWVGCLYFQSVAFNAPFDKVKGRNRETNSWLMSMFSPRTVKTDHARMWQDKKQTKTAIIVSVHAAIPLATLSTLGQKKQMATIYNLASWIMKGS